MFPRALLVVIESPFTLFLPGFFLVRRLSLEASEKAACSVGASIFILYLYSFLIYVLRLPGICHFLFPAGCLLLAWRCRKDLRTFFLSPEVKRLFLSLGVLLIWTAALLETIRNFSGGDWLGDWYEHYHRAIFFVDHLPLDTIFLGKWTLPARPPLFNLVSGHFLAELGETYPVYQATALLLNLTVFFPASLFFRKLWPQAKLGPLSLVAVLALNPSVMQNATYGWTKLLTVFYVLMAVWFYCRFLEKRETLLLYLSFSAVSIGFLTHYSAGPYAVFLGGHYLWSSLPRIRWKTVLGLAALNGLILFTWFGWSFAHYGSRVTVGANDSVARDTQRGPVATLQTIAANLRDTVVPPFFRANDPGRHYELSLHSLRDYSFLVYESNLFLALGLAGWLIAALATNRLARRRAPPGLRGFWAGFIPGTVLLGVCAVGERQPWGLAHLDLQPLILLGLVLVAAAWPTISRPLRCLMAVGLCCDFALGVALHFLYQHRFSPSESVYSVGYFNWQIKQAHHLSFLGDHWHPVLYVAEALLLGFILYRFRSAGPSRESFQDAVGAAAFSTDPAARK